MIKEKFIDYTKTGEYKFRAKRLHTDFNFDKIPNRSHYEFTKSLALGGNADAIYVIQCWWESVENGTLKYENINDEDSTGWEDRTEEQKASMKDFLKIIDMEIPDTPKFGAKETKNDDDNIPTAEDKEDFCQRVLKLVSDGMLDTSQHISLVGELERLAEGGNADAMYLTAEIHRTGSKWLPHSRLFPKRKFNVNLELAKYRDVVSNDG